LGLQLASWLLSVIFLLYIEAVKVLAILGRQSKRKEKRLLYQSQYCAVENAAVQPKPG